jgi:hypothetical protein
LKPVYVEDVPDLPTALPRLDDDYDVRVRRPRVYTNAEFSISVAQEVALRLVLIHFNFSLWYALAWLFEMLPNLPLAGIKSN